MIAPVKINLADVANPPRETFVIGTMIPLAKPSVIYGPTSVGKSALAAQIVFAVAAGASELWGLPLIEGGGPVLVYTAEDSLDDWKRKAAAVKKAGGLDMAAALERLYIIDQSEGLARLSEAVTYREPADPSTPERIVTRRINRATDEAADLTDAACQVGACLILVETASRLVDDEDNPSFAALQSALGRISRRTGAAVLLSHHATKAASKDNDSAIEAARGGGALIANARNALALFPADEAAAKPYRDRFPAEDVVVLTHGKSTSSTRRQQPIVLVRTDATWGAVLRLPGEVAFTPEQEHANVVRLDLQRQQEHERLGRLYDVVARSLPLRPLISASWLRDNKQSEIGVPARKIESLVALAVDRGVLKVGTRSGRGITYVLGLDPREPIRPSLSESGDA